VRQYYSTTELLARCFKAEENKIVRVRSILLVLLKVAV
jgi:hypothetical protein